MRASFLVVAVLLTAACTQTETDGVENAAGAIHKVRPAVKGSAAVGPATKPVPKKNLDRAFDIEEIKPSETKNLDRAFDIEESKPLDGRGADRAFDIEESKPANINRSKVRPGGGTPGPRPGL